MRTRSFLALASRAWLVGALVAASSSGGLALADAAADPVADEQSARRHFEIGSEYYTAGRFADAEREFLEVYRLAPSKTEILYNVYQCALKRGNPVRIVEFGRRYLDKAPPDFAERAMLEGTIEEQRKRLGTVRVEGATPKSEIYVDGERVGRAPLAAPVLAMAGPVRVEMRPVESALPSRTLEVMVPRRGEAVATFAPAVVVASAVTRDAAPTETRTQHITVERQPENPAPANTSSAAGTTTATATAATSATSEAPAPVAGAAAGGVAATADASATRNPAGIAVAVIGAALVVAGAGFLVAGVASGSSEQQATDESTWRTDHSAMTLYTPLGGVFAGVGVVAVVVGAAVAVLGHRSHEATRAGAVVQRSMAGVRGPSLRGDGAVLVF